MAPFAFAFAGFSAINRDIRFSVFRKGRLSSAGDVSPGFSHFEEHSVGARRFR